MPVFPACRYFSLKLCMDSILVQDVISDLPQSIVETILTKLPIRDAVRTSILSSKWRYKWANLTHLVFDDRCSSLYNDKGLVEGNLVKFITRFLFLHDGPIHMFTLSSTYLQGSPYIDQWLLFLSRKDVKELVIKLGDQEWFRAPTCLFSCRKLTRLELIRCELDPPPSFKGFLSLKCLVLQQVFIAPDKVENLLSSCPLLESLTLSYFDSLALSICAPNLKYLFLEGEFKDIRLENTPLLIFVSVSMYMTDDTAEHFEQSSSCNFDKFLGGVPCLQRLIGYIYFTKVRHHSFPFLSCGLVYLCMFWPNGLLMLYFFCPKYLSVGNELGKLPITYSHLKIVQLYEVSFEDMKEILVVLRLILNSPILQELQISVSILELVNKLMSDEDCHLLLFISHYDLPLV